MEIAKKLVCLLFLYLLARQDYRRKEVSTIVLYLFLGISLLFWLIQAVKTGRFVITDLLPGAFLLLTGAVSGEEIGYGDGLAVLAVGILMGGKFTLYAMTGGFWLAAVCILAGYLRRGFVREMALRVPYLPFLLIGMVVMTGVS